MFKQQTPSRQKPSEKPRAAWLHAELSMALWFADAALGARTSVGATGFVKSSWSVCNQLAAALTKAELAIEERQEIEAGLASVRRRLQAFDRGEIGPR
jgi:hypothetical protein